MRAPEGFPLPLGVGLSGMVAATGQLLYIADTQNDPRSLLAGFDRAVGLRTYLGLPIKIHDEVLGVLTLNTPTPREYPADELTYFTSFADQAALAIENARLFQEQQQAYGHLQRAQDELVRSEKLRALGQLAAGIAHDLNNCLAAIIGQVDMLRLSKASPGLDQEFATILTAANDGAHIVRRLQDFGRRRPIHALGPVPLHLVVLEAFDITRPQWQTDSQRRGRPITVETAIPELPPVQGDAAEIRKALTNLILNAVDAMPAGGTLSFRARAIPAPTSTDTTPLAIELQLTDTGSGMSEDVRQRIFDPFFTTKGPLGTGMGLSVVYSIVERHGGRIDVTSAPGHGTTFTLRFQVARGPADALPLPSVPPTSVPLRVLVVDDEARVLEVLTSMLESGGHSAIPADSGLAGLTRLTESRPDLVLTDLSMPDMSGLEFARHVRAAYPHLPILLCTGWNDITDAQELTRGAVTAVLEKPLSVMRLLTAIGQFRPARDGRAASEPAYPSSGPSPALVSPAAPRSGMPRCPS